MAKLLLVLCDLAAVLFVVVVALFFAIIAQPRIARWLDRRPRTVHWLRRGFLFTILATAALLVGIGFVHWAWLVLRAVGVVA